MAESAGCPGLVDDAFRLAKTIRLALGFRQNVTLRDRD